MANNLSDWSETNALDWLMGGATPTRPSARYVALHTGAPGETGASNEVSGSGYSRQVATFDAAASGATANTGALTFTASGGAFGTVSHVSIWSASSGGNCLWQGSLAASKTIADGDSLVIAAGELDLSLD